MCGALIHCAVDLFRCRDHRVQHKYMCIERGYEYERKHACTSMHTNTHRDHAHMQEHACREHFLVPRSRLSPSARVPDHAHARRTQEHACMHAELEHFFDFGDILRFYNERLSKLSKLIQKKPESVTSMKTRIRYIVSARIRYIGEKTSVNVSPCK